jgi:hypothetical protein
MYCTAQDRFHEKGIRKPKRKEKIKQRKCPVEIIYGVNGYKRLKKKVNSRVFGNPAPQHTIPSVHVMSHMPSNLLTVLLT